MKKASSRSQRGNKGIKGKHVLQICVLLGVCIWLIYQVKYSHDKKKEFYKKDGEKTTVLEKEDGLVKLGRKDLLPGYHNTEKEIEKHVEEDEDEEEKESKSKVEEEEKDEVVEEDEEDKSKQGEEVVEEDEEDKNKQGEEVVEEDGEEDKHEEDEIDEQDQSKNGGDTDKDDELLLLEEEKESGLRERDDNEKETNRADEIDMTVDEAREEHYKADDASSAVSHESRVLNTQKMKESSENSTETAHENRSNVTTSFVEVQKEPELKLREAESSEIVNKTTIEVKDGSSESSIPETKSAVTETVMVNSTEAVLEASRFLKNETEIMRERSQEHDRIEDGAPPSGSSELHNESGSNTTVPATITDKSSIQDEPNNSISESSPLIENISGSNTTEVKENSRSQSDNEIESSNLSSTEETEEVDDTSENSILQEEREALTDPQTLPDIRLEGNEEEDEEEAIAAE